MSSDLTLIDQMRLRKDPFEQGVISTIINECDIMKHLPWATLGTTEIGHRRSNSRGQVGFRKRGEYFGGIQKRSYDEVVDATFPMGCEITIDKTDYLDKNVSENPLTKATREALEDVSATFNNAFVNGDKAVDEDGLDGIKVRLAMLPSAQQKYAKDSSNALDLTAAANAGAGPTNGEMYRWLRALDDTKESLDGRTADIVITTSKNIRTLKDCLRRLSIYKDTEPQLPFVEAGNARRTSAQLKNTAPFSWNGVPWYAMGPKGWDQATEIVGSDTVGGQACDPIYFLKLGKPYLYGIQQYPIDVSETTLDPVHKVTYITVVDWPVGLHHAHPRFAAALRGQKTE